MTYCAHSVLFSRQQWSLNGRSPVSHFWDESEPRLFVCETVPVSSESILNSSLDMVKTTPKHCNIVINKG